MYRLITIAAVLLWMVAVAALFMRDVWPAWTAQDPPAMAHSQFERLGPLEQQFGLYGPDQERMGTAWSHTSVRPESSSIEGTVLLEASSFIPELRVETATAFDGEGALDSFSLDVHGVPLTVIRVHGERRGIYFPCELQIGPIRRQASLDLSASRLIGDSLRPFTFLPELRVGQSWRMQMLDPMAAVLRRRAEFTPIVARVTGTQTIEHEGRPLECFVVETSPQSATAWVDSNGRVLMQRVEVPGFGKLTVRSETYDEAGRLEARQRVPAMSRNPY